MMTEEVGIIFIVILSAVGFIWAVMLGKDEKKEALHKKQLKEEEEEEEEEARKLRAIEVREQKIKQVVDSIGLIEQASIAQKVIKSFPIADFQKLRPMLSSEGEIKKVVQEFHSKLGSQYEEMLLVEFGGEEPLPIRSDYEPLLKKIMDIGYRAILKEYCLLGSRSQEDMGGQTSREISDSGTWEDIKSRI